MQSSSKLEFTIRNKLFYASYAKLGWYRYDVRFAIPVYENDVLVRYNVFGARLLINHAENGKNTEPNEGWNLILRKKK